VFRLRKSADAGWSLAEISQVDLLDTAYSMKKIVPEISKIVGIGRNKPEAGYDDSG